MATLTLKNITKKWGDLVVVDNSNLEIKDTEFIVILGPSGCGKTTTMRMVAGLEDPTAGEILIDGQVVNDLEPKDRDVAMVFQNYGLYPNLSVYENIRFPLKVRKVDPNTHDERVRKAASLVELDELLERKPKELSGGQKQRVALARAIVREPKIFLMDEPLSNLDAKLRVSTRAQIKHLQYELKVTTIYVTHDQIEAMTLADRVIVMSKGKIQQIGTPKDIYNNPANTFVANFIGSPSMNLLQGEYQRRAYSPQNIANLAHSSTQKEGEVVLGFRPEDAEVSKSIEGISEQNNGIIHTKIFSIELLGEATLISVQINGNIVSAKADKSFEAEIDSDIYFVVPLDKCLLFEVGEHGKRIDN